MRASTASTAPLTGETRLFWMIIILDDNHIIIDHNNCAHVYYTLWPCLWPSFAWKGISTMTALTSKWWTTDGISTGVKKEDLITPILCHNRRVSNGNHKKSNMQCWDICNSFNLSQKSWSYFVPQSTQPQVAKKSKYIKKSNLKIIGTRRCWRKARKEARRSPAKAAMTPKTTMEGYDYHDGGGDGGCVDGGDGDCNDLTLAMLMLTMC